MSRWRIIVVALLMLGASPFVIRAIPEKILPRTFGPAQVAGTGFVSMMLMLLTGVTGPLLDTMFLRSPLERRQIIANTDLHQIGWLLLRSNPLNEIKLAGH